VHPALAVLIGIAINASTSALAASITNARMTPSQV
jgi:hypothetical protein